MSINSVGAAGSCVHAPDKTAMTNRDRTAAAVVRDVRLARISFILEGNTLTYNYLSLVQLMQSSVAKRGLFVYWLLPIPDAISKVNGV